MAYPAAVSRLDRVAVLVFAVGDQNDVAILARLVIENLSQGLTDGVADP